MKNLTEINIYDHLLTDDRLRGVLDFIRTKGFQYGWKSSENVMFSHWNLGFSETGISRFNRENIIDELPPAIKLVWGQIQTTVLKEYSILLRAYCNAHTYGTEGYIHRDSKYADDITAIIYLNKLWDPNWAGETILLKDNEIIKAVMPKWNRLFVFPSNLKHVARLVLVFKATKSLI